jgi:hypothetical protein
LSVEEKQNSKNIWTALNQLTNKTKETTVVRVITADALNNHFTSIADQVIQNDKSKEND